MRNHIVAFLIAFIALPTIAVSDEVQDVRVVNLPETQSVKGSVEIEGLVRHSAIDRKENILVPTAQRNNTNSLTYAGTIQTDGFTSIVLSLQGEIQSESFTPGKVGALLIPNEKPILRAFHDNKTILFPLEINTEVVPGKTLYFTTESVKQVVGFPEYLVYLYNSTNKNVEVNLYMYLTN